MIQQHPIDYYTLDEVNAWSARLFGEEVGFRVQITHPKDDTPASDSVALIVDLDSLASNKPERDRELAVIVRLSRRIPVAVHSYHFGEEDRQQLGEAGVIVATRLDPLLFALISAAIQSLGPTKQIG